MAALAAGSKRHDVAAHRGIWRVEMTGCIFCTMASANLR